MREIIRLKLNVCTRQEKRSRMNYACVGLKPSIKPLVTEAHYSERQDKPFSLQIQRLAVDLNLSCGFLFFALWALMG